jgi:hypothetical protein
VGRWRCRSGRSAEGRSCRRSTPYRPARARSDLDHGLSQRSGLIGTVPPDFLRGAGFDRADLFTQCLDLVVALGPTQRSPASRRGRTAPPRLSFVLADMPILDGGACARVSARVVVQQLPGIEPCAVTGTDGKRFARSGMDPRRTRIPRQGSARSAAARTTDVTICRRWSCVWFTAAYWVWCR